MEKLKRVKTRLDYRSDPWGKYKANLTKEYKSVFRYMKFKKIKILELGIHYGGSLLFWSDFFLYPGARIFGLDINHRVKAH